MAQSNGAAGGDSAASADASANSSAGETYPPEYFARFSPRSALDIVNQVPNFQLDETSDDRGLGEASQNLLINGQRITGKNNDAQSALRQIAASAVVRVEVLDGAQLGIPGLTGRVVNVIVRQNEVRVQYRWEGQNRRNIEDQITNARVSASGRLGATDFTLSLANDAGARRGGQGPELVRDANGNLLIDRFQLDEFHMDNPTLTGTINREWGNGTILNLNLSGASELSTIHQTGLARIIASNVLRDEIFVRRYREQGVEGGGDIEFDLGGGRLKLAGLQSYAHTNILTATRFAERTTGNPATGNRFNPVYDEGESVLRAEYGWGSGAWLLSVEGAYNFLRTSADFAVLDAAGNFLSTPISGTDFYVDEWRGEALATRNLTLSPTFSAQITLGGEYSAIRATNFAPSGGGSTTVTRTYFRPKGSLSLTWNASRRLRVNAAIRRRVGQLALDDFSAGVDLMNGTGTAANANLVPEQSWRVEGQVARSLGSAGSISIGGYHEWISDIVDSIPVSPTEETIGNLPRAQRYGLNFRGTLLLDAIGWRGARVDVRGDFNRSRVPDPVTGRVRRISDDLIRNWAIDFRDDIPGTPIAFGGQITELIRGPIFRLDQYFRSQLARPVTTIYVEHKDVMGLTVRLSLRNLINTYDDIRRDVSVDRRDGPLAFTERQTRNIYLIGILTISGSF
ncbi:MAG: hypothetical protein IT553_03920 [Sphingomonadaceae bacterium]|nr:hypothetical protein [Sphingomonadaceae bacterium]